MKQRKKAEFYTDTEIIENTTIGQASRRNKGKYNAVYFINRPIVLQRDEFTCVVCGYKSKRQKGQVNDLEVHHIDPNGGSHTDNLQTVCLECHRRLTAIEQAI